MSSAQLTGLGAVGNGRILEGKTLLFDVEYYVADGESVVAALRFFNRNNMEFQQRGLYEIRASVAKMPIGGINVGKDGSREHLEDTEYDLIGDITWLHQVTCSDPRQRPYLDIVGIATNVLKADAEFDIDPKQYTSFLSAKAERDKSILPIHAIIPDSPRYKIVDGKSTKPIPTPNSAVATSGFLTRVLPREDDSEARPDRFYMAVESVTFIGHASHNPLPDTKTRVREQKGKRKHLIDFNSPESMFTEGSSTKKAKTGIEFSNAHRHETRSNTSNRNA
ncbi:hypothetical protein F5878DRAFT_620126 [Lentinula raphanica]|uniref:Uncharacterized protein n=1 Tax=Lentinula raphanica TaxID=153919 RepID=A0AA38P8T0_9AGAR|nr:hypothetical protein EV360DRAFT_69266 [Lentinula raphanica]KAJ3838225.1 hypothetical protein F5878DRAFT_620126 [Lentinula raphanica]